MMFNVVKIGKIVITFGYRVFKKGDKEPRTVGHNVTVCQDIDTFKKKDSPDWLRQRLGAKLKAVR